jgi:hypothetical protein
VADEHALAQCPTLSRAQYLVLAQRLDGAASRAKSDVIEIHQRARERRELIATIARAKAAVDRIPWRYRRPDPPASCLAARALLLRAMELLDVGAAGPALERMRAAAAELKGKQASPEATT